MRRLDNTTVTHRVFPRNDFADGTVARSASPLDDGDGLARRGSLDCAAIWPKQPNIKSHVFPGIAHSQLPSLPAAMEVVLSLALFPPLELPKSPGRR